MELQVCNRENLEYLLPTKNTYRELLSKTRFKVNKHVKCSSFDVFN